MTAAMRTGRSRRLRVAPDAWVLDTTGLDADAAFVAARAPHRAAGVAAPSAVRQLSRNVRVCNPNPGRAAGRCASLHSRAPTSGVGMRKPPKPSSPAHRCDDFAAMLDETLGLEQSARRQRRQGHRGRDRQRHRHRRRRPEVRGPRPAQGIRRRRPAARGPGRRHRRGVSSSASRTAAARSCSAATRPAARRAGTGSRSAFTEHEQVEGAIFGRVKGGFTVDLGGALAFLPGSQVDIRPVRDVGPLISKHEPFPILKMDRPPRQHRRVAAAPSSRRAAPSSATSCWRPCRRAKSAKAWSRTSPTTARSSTWAASTACCTSPT